MFFGVNKKVIGLNLHFRKDGGEELRVAWMELKKGKLLVSRSEVVTVENIKNLPSDIPISISITGRGIITRNFTNVEEDADFLGRILPGAAPEDFLLQSFPCVNGSRIVSVMRLDVLTNKLEELTQNNDRILAVFLGPAIVGSVFSLLHIDLGNKGGLSFLDYEIKFENGSIQGVSPTEKISESFFVEELNIDSSYLPAFASGLEFLFNNYPELNFPPKVNSAREEFSWKKKFKLSSLLIYPFLFGALIVNYFLYSGYKESFGRLITEQGYTREIKNRADSARNALLKNKELFDKIGANHHGPTSFFADRLVSDMPAGINLNRLVFFPVKKTELASGQGVSFLKDLVIVNGSCTSNDALNKWIEKMRTREWIENVHLRNFVRETTNQPADFSIELNIR